MEQKVRHGTEPHSHLYHESHTHHRRDQGSVLLATCALIHTNTTSPFNTVNDDKTHTEVKFFLGIFVVLTMATYWLLPEPSFQQVIGSRWPGDPAYWERSLCSLKPEALCIGWEMGLGSCGRTMAYPGPIHHVLKCVSTSGSLVIHTEPKSILRGMLFRPH